MRAAKAGAAPGQPLAGPGQSMVASGQSFLEPEQPLPQEPSPELLSRLPPDLARRYRAFPLGAEEGCLVLALPEPEDLLLLDELQLQLGCRVRGVRAEPEWLEAAIERYYGAGAQTVQSVLANLGEGVEVLREEEETAAAQAEALANEAPVVRLVNSLLVEALQRGASDVHLEPFEGELRVRYRIDGILYDVPGPPRRLFPAIASRVKIMAGLDIAEKRLPQDGRIRLRLLGRDVDIRVSTAPTIFGESIVLRLLERSSILYGLTDLGMGEELLQRFQRLIHRSHGIILVTGPTGSGKTTTLYAALNALNSPERKIITVEDPVEYQLRGVNQMQVREQIGFTFAQGLRTILRQDPDVILVGEIRDEETARMAIQAALTGHLVFSTLHTNDAPGAVTRLLDIGIEPYLVASTVCGVLSQRLVRVLCSHCREGYRPAAEELVPLLEELPADLPELLFRPVGCPRCGGIGYRGRTGIYELMLVDEPLAELVVSRPSTNELRRAALARGMERLRQDGWRKVQSGVTTVEEVLRVTQE
ncbi:MAG: type II secretion system ATPase GspE [Bacillota bacterium]|nr:type II secretion system ATPase GspE [Bacillota bacterium]